MSETDAETPAEPPKPESPETPDEPDLSDDDMVEIPDDVAEQVAEADAEESEADDTEEADGGGDSVPSTATATNRTTLGDVYCNALGMATVAAKDRAGSEVDDRQDAMDEYADMARQLDLDEFVDDWLAEHGQSSELSPGQGILVFTLVFCGSVMVEDAELSNAVMEGVGE
ncbi:hypothetical protein [Haloarchaeobius litoreus]|uniref:Uncharacterized protein n=1 Tax=Haloarchaeobius litoreus TaxID=755306 RepID=A0ABD6DGY9_9EURY|nr:hypothetical protein [Haloarchaeobius litoreus]